MQGGYVPYVARGLFADETFAPGLPVQVEDAGDVVDSGDHAEGGGKESEKGRVHGFRGRIASIGSGI